MPEFTLTQIQLEITRHNLGWQAGSTSLADLPPEAQDRRLGLHLAPGQQDRLRRAFEAVVCQPCTFPPAYDWRDVDGHRLGSGTPQDWTTPTRDQGACGACVAFGVLGAVEGMAKWEIGDPARDVDLSEAHLFFCGCGPCCESGWWPEEALDYLIEQGVPDEVCFPYQDRDMACRNTCTDWAKQVTRISDWQAIFDAEARKQWLSSIGPLVGAMAVYRDFFYYTGGVYRPVSTDLGGYHAVTVVGYDEAQSAWLCKNSWGTGWGEAGWFRLGYGACGLDTEFPAWGIESVILPEESPPEPSGCSPLRGLMGALPLREKSQPPAEERVAADQAYDKESLPTFDGSAHTIRAQASRAFALILDAQSTSGYTWQAEVDERYLALESQQFESEAGGLRGAGRERLVFRALRPGQCRLELIYRRPWEQQARERRTLNVEIENGGGAE